MIPDAVFTLDKAKAHLRVTWPDEDALITTYLDGAVAACESFTRRAWTERTWKTLANSCGAVDKAVYHALLSPATEVTVRSLDAVPVELPTTAYAVTNVYGHSVLVVNSWAGITVPAQGNAAEIVWKAAPSEVPADVYAAVMLYLGDLYANREAQNIGSGVMLNPRAEEMLRPYVVDMHL